MEPQSEDVVSQWQKQYTEGTLSSLTIRKYWSIKVPEIFSPQANTNCLKLVYDEELAQKQLFDPMERFMCRGDPTETYQMVMQLDNPPSLCGRVFKTGDPTYGCRDCGMDPTCVLCADCFKNSPHSKHRYKISTSSGGGYCDCGDKEAWKNDVFCNIHIKGEMVEQSHKPLEKLPQDLVERIQFMFDHILQYAKELLTYENTITLPSDLEIKDCDREPTNMSSLFDIKDTYVTMLFNDETHTYDQVIYTLERAIDCSKRDAVAFATTIDREGRCIVKCSSYQVCNKAKEIMERHKGGTTKSYKVQVVHSHIIAHQVFAGRLLNWLLGILESAHAFRLIFSDIASRDNCSLIESIFRTDTQMWKTARIQWHKLFISGMLMDLDSKKVFARVFTKQYSKMMKDFIQDDHEHSVCIVSLTVQLFTMPTIAHMLIGDEDVLARLLNTFLSECQSKLKQGKLALEHRSSNTAPFRRIQYILYDLKYLLGIKPEVWTTDIRKGFIHGYSNLLKLLKMMQGMDPVVRQVGQHIEYEPEWESAFNLHIKLASVIPLVIDWCSSDKMVLIKAYRSLLKVLGEQITDDMKRRFVRELLNYSVSCIEYDVSSAPVSIHLPLSRLLAGLTLQLETYGLNFNSVEFQEKGNPSPEELMEPVLRTQVVIAQVNAGMWRRNGFYLSNQIYFYHNVRCRQEMLDRDIMLLQIAATQIDSNEYLIHLLNRFNLMNWARDDFEINYLKGSDDDMRQTVVLAEEYLHLVMTLVSERYTPGIGKVTEEERIKKEIIQLLCIEPMPHSVLNKALPEGTNHETGMEKVIDEVAVFKKPSGTSTAKGYFELREQYYKDYNLFFYHYTREEQSKSEVAQRARKKAANEEECCPPPKPPALSEPFISLCNILQCDVFLHLVKVVLTRLADPKSQSVSESQFQIILHLIGYALHEEERFHKKEDPYFHFTVRARNTNILGLMEALVGTSKTATHKDLLTWTIRRYREILELRAESGTKMKPIAKTVVASSSSSSGGANEEKKRRADIAAMRRQRIMAKMANMQQNFIKTNEVLFQSISSNEQQPASEIPPPPIPMEYTEALPSDMIAIGPKQSAVTITPTVYTCILCHQDDLVSNAGPGPSKARSMVLGALIQRSTVLSKNRAKVVKDLESHDTTVLPTDLHWGVHASSCGHAMHSQCWQRYFDDVFVRERRRPYRFRQNLSIDIEKNEYLCPLCEKLCNTAMPLLPSVMTDCHTQSDAAAASLPPQHFTLAEWLQFLSVTLEKKRKETKDEMEFVAPPQFQEVVNEMKDIYSSPANNLVYLFNTQMKAPEIPPDTKEMMTNFAHAVYMYGLGVHPNQMNPRVPQMVWCNTAYTIKVLEETQRNSDLALLTSLSSRNLESLTSLVKFAAYSSISIDSKNVRNSVMRLLEILLESSENTQSLMEWDAFSMLVSLCLGLPSLFYNSQGVAKGTVQDLYLLKLCFYAHIVQLVLSYEGPCISSECTEDTNTAMETDVCEDKEPDTHEMDIDDGEGGVVNNDASWLKNLLEKARALAGMPHIKVNAQHLLEYVHKTCLPFLRCCGMFFHFLTEIPVPVELKCSVWMPESEFYCLARYLGLAPHLQQSLDEPYFDRLLEKWCSHPNLVSYITEVNSTCKFKWIDINQLVELPDDYSELINTVSQFPCPASSGDDSRTPTMCLVCKKMLCSQSYCCQIEFPEGSQNMVGACTYHAFYCSSGTGIFLRVRECRVLLLSGRIKGCYVAPPYLDEYGETDQCLKRGNPLHLDKAQYKKLHAMWLAHAIPNTIAHTMESSNSLIATDWQHL